MTKKQNTLVSFLLGFIIQCTGFAQPKLIEVTVTSRVDTTIPEVREIYHLWKNYLNSRPDSLYDNPYWSTKEKNKYMSVNLHFDRSSWIMYQGTNAFQVLQVYKPKVMAIEKEFGKYYIITMYFGENMDPRFQKENPPWITRHYASKEKNEWKLENSIQNVTREWRPYTTKNIMYVCTPLHRYNPDLAAMANAFIDSVVALFHLPLPQSFEYYMAGSPDELCKLYNLDYWLDFSPAMTHWPLRQLCTSGHTEYNPHEFTHLIFKGTKHWIISEGLATWLGGSGYDGCTSYDDDLKYFANEIRDNVTITFNDIYSRKFHLRSENYPLYIAGAFIVKLTCDKKGIDGVRELLSDETEDIYTLIAKYTGIQKEEIDFRLMAEIKKFADK
ncbi:MAG: hypothetical protein HYY40_06515 [Bacteroidetes bacterium]|nr:hypothetical protein [Bacteroidota bacterium]